MMNLIILILAGWQAAFVLNFATRALHLESDKRLSCGAWCVAKNVTLLIFVVVSVSACKMVFQVTHGFEEQWAGTKVTSLILLFLSTL